MPPKECPTSTYGPGMGPALSAACRSSTTSERICGRGPGSLKPLPARSKAQTRVFCAITGWVLYQTTDQLNKPAIRMTVGPPAPVQCRLIRRPPINARDFDPSTHQLGSEVKVRTGAHF